MMRFLKCAVLTASVAGLCAAPVMADEITESYVQDNANLALASLNNPELDRLARRAEFNNLMEQFTDIDLIAMRVLGKYYRQFTEQEKADFTAAFKQYALATYEAELDKYRGTEVQVVGSQDGDENRTTKVDSVVTTVISLPESNKGLTVLWRVVEFQPTTRYAEVFGEGFKVTDVALDLDGGRIWLAQNQRDQFLSLLDRNGGDAAALISEVNAMTERLFARASASATTVISEDDSVQAG